MMHLSSVKKLQAKWYNLIVHVKPINSGNISVSILIIFFEIIMLC